MMTGGNPGFRIAVTVPLVAAALAGCAELNWHKAGADAAIRDRDLGECQGQVRLAAHREAGITLPDVPRVVGADALGRPIMGPSSRIDTDRLLLEHDLLHHCMRGKGYELLPVERR